MPRAHNDPIETVREALVSLRRLFQRRELAKEWSAAFGRAAPLDYGDLRLLDAVRSTTGGDPDAGATVGEIAVRLGIDPSRASRMTARAVKRGLLVRHAAQGDGRKVVVRVTPSGARLQARGSDLTRARIALALDSWSTADRARFAQLFGRFARAL